MAEKWRKVGTLGGCTEYRLDIPMCQKGQYHCFIHKNMNFDNGDVYYSFSSKLPGCNHMRHRLFASSFMEAKIEVEKILLHTVSKFIEEKEEEIKECKELEKMLK